MKMDVGISDCGVAATIDRRSALCTAVSAVSFHEVADVCAGRTHRVSSSKSQSNRTLV